VLQCVAVCCRELQCVAVCVQSTALSFSSAWIVSIHICSMTQFYARFASVIIYVYLYTHKYTHICIDMYIYILICPLIMNMHSYVLSYVLSYIIEFYARHDSIFHFLVTHDSVAVCLTATPCDTTQFTRAVYTLQKSHISAQKSRIYTPKEPYLRLTVQQTSIHVVTCHVMHRIL